MIKNGEIYSDLTTNFYDISVNGDTNRMPITGIVIHHNATTNKYAAMETWRTDGVAGTSAHYEIADDEIWGCLGENYVAYHAGNYQVNQCTIGIEHLNSTGSPNWLVSEETYKTSAKLIRDICKRYDLPINRNTIKMHKEYYPTACPGGVDIEKLVKMAQDESMGIKENEVEEMSTYLIKANGKGYAVVTGGKAIGVASIKTVDNYIKQGFKVVEVDPKDFDIHVKGLK